MDYGQELQCPGGGLRFCFCFPDRIRPSKPEDLVLFSRSGSSLTVRLQRPPFAAVPLNHGAVPPAVSSFRCVSYANYCTALVYRVWLWISAPSVSRSPARLQSAVLPLTIGGTSRPSSTAISGAGERFGSPVAGKVTAACESLIHEKFGAVL